MLLFIVPALIVLWLGILSLRDGFRFYRYVDAELKREQSNFTPMVSVLAPYRGIDEGLAENVAAILSQDYPAYEIVFVSDNLDDPALQLIEEMIRRRQPSATQLTTRLVVAGEATQSGQKVHNLMAAARAISNHSEVIAFVDSDARPGPTWLRSLVTPLADPKLGATTGYRWFIPPSGGLASRLRAVWNASIASALGSRTEKNFCWGGSTAIRRSEFDNLKIIERWKGTVSDDFTITRALHEAKLPIKFVPSCLVPSFEHCSFRELLEFTNRQLKITRVYSPNLWLPLLIGTSLFNLVFWGGTAWIVLSLLLERQLPLIATLLIAAIFLLGTAKAYVRFRAVSLALADYRAQLQRDLWAQLLCWPLASLLYLVNAVVAGVSRRIEWRGITYELKSPGEAVIISRAPTQR